jgi:hypothetical protein
MVEKAQIIVLDTDEKIDVMFNPEDYTISTSTTMEVEGSTPFFNKVDIGDFTVTLLFDTYEKQSDVRDITNKIAKLLMPTIEGAERKRAPICLFSWGKFTYKGAINNLSQQFTMFLGNGTPVRAKLTVVFKSVATPEEYAKYMGIEACRKFWTVKSGDRIDLIAYTALKDASLWRKIADENHIDNPLAFPSDDDIGKILIIPD